MLPFLAAAAAAAAWEGFAVGVSLCVYVYKSKNTGE